MSETPQFNILTPSPREYINKRERLLNKTGPRCHKIGDGVLTHTCNRLPSLGGEVRVCASRTVVTTNGNPHVPPSRRGRGSNTKEVFVNESAKHRTKGSGSR